MLWYKNCFEIFNIPSIDIKLKSANVHLYPLVPSKSSDKGDKQYVPFHKMLAFRKGKINATTHVIII